MKTIPSLLVSLLTLAVAARPHAMEDGDPLPQKSRITAFVVDEDGKASVECWEISSMVDNSRTVRSKGSKATAHAMQVAGGYDLNGLDILTWPPLSPIWPPQDDSQSVHGEWFDLANHFSLFTIQGGLINFNVNFRLGSNSNDDDDDEDTHIFSLENGDDWFYFEDSYTDSDAARSANAEAPPFTISTISATETEMLRMRFKQQPKHKVLHKGGCSFTGIKTPAESSSLDEKVSGTHSPVTVQVHMEM